MTSEKYTTQKHCYQSPTIEKIVIDCEISLQLQSAAPTINIDDPESCELMNAPEHFNKSPFA